MPPSIAMAFSVIHRFVLTALILPVATLSSAADTPVQNPQTSFWESLQGLCGQAFAGRLVAYDEDIDAGWLPERLVIHVRRCSSAQIEIPLHVGENRSRTWILTQESGLMRLKHDHRHADGSEEAVTWYGGHTTDPGRAWRQTFPVDDFSKALFLTHDLAGSITNFWYMEVVPGSHFAYGLTRPGRHLRAECDLTESVEPPPAPWGHD
ncbi:MAG: hypothetical protein ACXIUM_08785 [Wenzhouxiangella sp.]